MTSQALSHDNLYIKHLTGLECQPIGIPCKGPKSREQSSGTAAKPTCNRSGIRPGLTGTPPPVATAAALQIPTTRATGHCCMFPSIACVQVKASTLPCKCFNAYLRVAYGEHNAWSQSRETHRHAGTHNRPRGPRERGARRAHKTLRPKGERSTSSTHIRL
eukprot:1158093-Pelagomonas_calceolata.AAC.2